MHSRLNGINLFPFPKSEPSMDFSRRRGPPAPLQLGAAYQAIVFRGYKKFNTPQPLENCLLVDSACDQVIRQSSNQEIQRQRDSVESKRNSLSIKNDAFYTLDETQIESSDEGSEYTLWSQEDNFSDEKDSRSSCTLSNSSHDSLRDQKQFHMTSLAGRFSHAWSTNLHSESTDSDGSSKSPIKIPAMCKIEQAGIHSWTIKKVKHHHRHTSSI